MILGMPWLERVNPEVDWKLRSIKYNQKTTDVPEIPEIPDPDAERNCNAKPEPNAAHNCNTEPACIPVPVPETMVTGKAKKK